MKRTIIKIDENLCNGCGNCVVGCHEGALQLIDNKAVMISDLYCDGLGACIGECPVGAITLEEREAVPYDEIAVMERLAPKGEAVILAHLAHLKEHNEMQWVQQGVEYIREHGLGVDLSKIGLPAEGGAAPATGSEAAAKNAPEADGGQPERQAASNDWAGERLKKSSVASVRASEGSAWQESPGPVSDAASSPGEGCESAAGRQADKPLGCGCPGTMAREIKRPFVMQPGGGPVTGMAAQQSELRQFPVQLHLLNPAAGFLKGADLLLAADCTAFASGEFHSRFLRGKVLAIACPKLDSDTQAYVDKLAGMIDVARIDTLTVLVMEVPCCAGLVKIARAAREAAARNVPIKVVVLSVSGEVKSEEWI